MYWVGNGQNTSQVVTLQVTAVAVGGTLTATINAKTVVYTCVAGDTVATAAAAWQQLLSAATAPNEFGEITFAVSPTATDTITCTATTPGTPFAGMTGGLTSAGGGGATVTQTTTVPNSSKSDVTNVNNWNRAGTPAVPVNGDDVVLSGTNVPLLWNLSGLAAVQFATLSRYQDFTGTVGLPDQNANGYPEYRPTYFQFTGPPAGTLTVNLGLPSTSGSGPGRERYDAQTQRTNWNILASGSALDGYAVRIKNVNANSTLQVTAATCAVAYLPTDVSTVASAVVNAGATLLLSTGVTIAGTLAMNGGTALLGCAPGTLTVGNGSRCTVYSTGLTYAAVNVNDSSSLVWDSNSTVTTLTMTRGSTFDKSGDGRAVTVTNSTVDSDCRINDPLGVVTYTNATTVKNQVNTGVFLTSPNRTFKVT